MKNCATPHGSVLLLVLIFGAIFFVVLGSLAQFVLVENRAQDSVIGQTKAFTVAEAGLQYYKWFLAHFPSDFKNGTGQAGPYVLNYTDAQGVTAGTYTLTIGGSSACGSTQTVAITSRGVSTDFPTISSTLVAQYGAPTAATYAQIIDDGSTPEVDFTNLKPDFPALETAAQANGIFLSRHDIPQDPHLGYHLIFNANGTVTVNKVTAIDALHGVKVVGTTKSVNDYTLIQTEESYQTLPISTDCGLIFSEDNTWIEGVIPSKIALVVSAGTGSGSAPDVIIHGNLTYAASDGTAGLTVLGEHNVVIAPDSPTNLTMHGVFAATNGAFGRNNYYGAGANCLYEHRNALSIVGTIISTVAPITPASADCADGTHAGYQTQTITADPKNAANPPPYTPTTSAEHRFINWQQQ